jgi:hypothetical protein
MRLVPERPKTVSPQALDLATTSMLAEDLSQRLTAILMNTQALLRTFRKTPPADPEIQAVITDVSHDAVGAAKALHQMREALAALAAHRCPRVEDEPA